MKRARLLARRPLVKCSPRFNASAPERAPLLLEFPHAQEFLSPASNELVRLEAAQFLHMLVQRLLNGARSLLVSRMCAAEWLGNYFVDDAQLEQVGRGDLEGARRPLAHFGAL